MEINATFLGQAVAFLIFAVICMKYIWPPLMNVIEKRQKEIADGLSNAEKAKKTLELATSGAKDTLKQARDQAQKIIEDANKQRAEILDRAQSEAGEEKAKILAQARAEIEAERNKAQEDLRSQISQLAVAGAEKILMEKANAETDKGALRSIESML
ncbi:MAG: F0F1 ATP synthase subunit B [Succinivibrio sp.]|nr:F0F1 ATP synthase subunit B [Succinivibrio sp.]